MSTYSSNLRIELPTDGTQAGTWGNTTNANMAFVMDSAIAGYQEVTVSAASQALTYTNGPSTTAASNQAVYAMLKIISAPSAFSLYAPPNSKSYIIWNASGFTMSLRVSDVIGSTTPIAGNVALSIANGNKVMVWSDGVSFYDVQAQNLTGTLAIANGGTGQVTANAALNALLPSQTSNANKYLQTDGTNSSWDAISLSTADITGTLAVANGGTGATDAATARTNLAVPSTTGSGASGTWGISISGNAATATNGLTTGNYNSYAPTLTGTGASGTWGISISGNAATAINAINPASGGSFVTSLNIALQSVANSVNATNAVVATRTTYGGGNLSSNIANGNSAFGSNTTGEYNTVMGSAAMPNNITGSNSTAIGFAALYNNLQPQNTAVGSQALYTNSTGVGSVAVGYYALRTSNGDGNTAVGTYAGTDISSGYYNTALGRGSLSATTTQYNCTGLGYSAQITGNNQVQLGDSNTTTYAYGAVQNRSDLRDKTDVRDTTLGLNFVMSLRPVDYKWDMRDFYRPVAPVRPEDPSNEQAMADYEVAKAAWIAASKLENITHDGSKKRTRYHHGFIAQEVIALNAGFGGVQDHKIAGGDDVLSLGYEEMIAPLVKAIQELKAEFDAYKAAHP